MKYEEGKWKGKDVEEREEVGENWKAEARKDVEKEKGAGTSGEASEANGGT